MSRYILLLVVALGGVLGGDLDRADAGPAQCTVASVVDGDTFDCTDGTRVRLLQINTPERGECGYQWAKDALANIFLRPGTVARLDYDRVTTDRYGRTLAAPIVRGADGADYNISIVMVYVGLAKAATTVTTRSTSTGRMRPRCGHARLSGICGLQEVRITAE